jgi:hypothetical protein
MLVPWYLITAYAYYLLDESLIEDHQFDSMAKELLENYDTIEHRHKNLIKKDDLLAGTLLLAEEDYPLIVKSVARELVKNLKITPPLSVKARTKNNTQEEKINEPIRHPSSEETKQLS